MLKKNKKLIVILALIILSAVSAIFLIRQFALNKDQEVKDSSGSNLQPPTQEEIQQAEDNKARIDAQEKALRDSSTQNGSSKQMVVPLITEAMQYGDKVEVGSYVPGIFEDNGTCTAIFTKGSLQITRQVTAVKEGDSTFCPLFSISNTEFTNKGTWNVVVTYESPSASGSSSLTTLEVK